MPLANNFAGLDLAREKIYELKIHICTNCWLFQIENQPSASSMFNERYPFFTGSSKYMVEHFRGMADYGVSLLSKEIVKFNVLEIGCNDGSLLEKFVLKEIPHLGIDPSSNVVERALKKGCTAQVGFFSENFSHQILQKYNKFNLIFAANVVCHINNIKDFFSGVSNLLAENGLFIFEEPYMLDVLEKVSYDQIYDEHVFLFSILSIKNILKEFNLQLIKVSRQSTHGGSLRYVVARNGEYEIDKSVYELEQVEKDYLMDSVDPYVEFARKCEKRRKELTDLLLKLQSEGKRVYGYAATSKSTTILNYCGIDDNLVLGIGDSTPEKQGTFTPGTGIPVISIEELREIEPDYIILFAWNHFNEIAIKEQTSPLKQSRWILLAPEIEVISI